MLAHDAAQCYNGICNNLLPFGGRLLFPPIEAITSSPVTTRQRATIKADELLPNDHGLPVPHHNNYNNNKKAMLSQGNRAMPL